MNPWPGVPSTFSLGTFASSKISSRVSLARQPILSSFLPARTPGSLGRSAAWPTPSVVHRSRSTVSLVTMKLVIPLLLRPGLGPRGHREDLAHACVGDEDLGAVEDVVIALVHRGRGGTARVTAGSGLRQSEAAEHLPGGEQWDIPPLLFLRAELDDG